MEDLAGQSVIKGQRQPRAWSFLAIQGPREYQGNVGYADDPSTTYHYDSNVGNHLQVGVGDIAIIRDRDAILGIARVEDIETATGEKERFRCPQCRITNLRRRAKEQNSWRCHFGHEFSEPLREMAPITTYHARYEKSFRPCPDVTIAQIADAVIRKSDQMSIKELDLAKLEAVLAPSASDLISGYAAGLRPFGGDPDDPPHETSIIQERRAVLRQIALRRGQKAFRDRLIRRYGAICQVSECRLIDLIEAAHIEPYSVRGDNSAANGLLLRSDLHTLFDLALLAIEPGSLIIRLHPSVGSDGYEQFEGRKLQLNGASRPKAEYLKSRWDLFLANAITS